MTRETKIGLLVGLAFIIVIGILLSDHINSTTDTARADTVKAADNVRDSVATPGTASGTTTVVTPAPVVPREPVRTEIQTPQPSDPGRSIVQIAPGGDPSVISIPRTGAQDQTSLTQQPDSNVQIAPNAGDPQVAANQNNAIPQNLIETAKANGVELTKADGSPIVTRPAPPGQNASTTNTNSAPLPPGAREVKAEPNDSVSKLASKYMGANTKTNRDLIIKANPSLQARPDLVVVGKSYIIPAVSNAPTSSAPAPQPAPAQHSPAPAPQPSQAPSAQPSGTFYTVKENDNLWRIAADQLGSGARWTEIRDLNQDVLKGSEQVHVNMRLRLPAKAN